MRVIACPFCNGGYPQFVISTVRLLPRAWLECPKCHTRSDAIILHYLNLSDPDICMKDRRRLGRMWNRWWFVGTSEKVRR